MALLSKYELLKQIEQEVAKSVFLKQNNYHSLN